MKNKEFNRTQELARRDGRVQVVNLHPTFKPSKSDTNPTANPYKHLDGLASDFAGPGTSMHKLPSLATLKVGKNSILDKDFIAAVQHYN